MDLGYFDNYMEDKPASILDPEQQMDELAQLQEIADKVGSYRWVYKPGLGEDEQEHIGTVTQDLYGIPGLDSCVIRTEGQPDQLDTNYLSAATFSMLAALTRIVFKLADKAGIDLTETIGETNELTYNKELSQELQVPAASETGTASTASSEAAGTIANENIQPSVENE